MERPPELPIGNLRLTHPYDCLVEWITVSVAPRGRVFLELIPARAEDTCSSLQSRNFQVRSDWRGLSRRPQPERSSPFRVASATCPVASKLSDLLPQICDFYFKEGSLAQVKYEHTDNALNMDTKYV